MKVIFGKKCLINQPNSQLCLFMLVNIRNYISQQQVASQENPNDQY